MQERLDSLNSIEGLPVVLCPTFIYPGMKTIMAIENRQLRDLVHILTTAANPSPDGQKKFITMRKYEDMRGFVVVMKHIFRSSQVVAEIVGDARILIDSVFVPPEREGLYQNQNEALRFANGTVIEDDNPYA